MIFETILVAVGANLPDRHGRPALETCRRAVERVANSTRLRLDAVSPWYRTSPVPASDQPDYVNAVARFSGDAEPGELLRRLQAIEAEAGRVRGAPNAARVLDLDLLAIDDLVLTEIGLILPHPRLEERAFVLYPLCDVAPEWRHPLLSRRAEELRDCVDGRGVRLA